MTPGTAQTNRYPSESPPPSSGASSNRTARACILGASLDVGNRGVLALGVSVAGLLASANPDMRIAFHYWHHSGGVKRLSTNDSERDIQIEVLNCRMSPKSAYAEHILVILALAVLHRIGFRAPAQRNAWLRSILSADFIGDIRGGDSFSDIYGFRRFLTGSLPLISVVFLSRPFTMLAQTYGPFRRRASRMLARFILRRAAALQTRDKNCAELVLRLCGRNPDFCPDVAFTLEPATPVGPRIHPDEFSWNGHEPVIGLNVSGLLYMGGYTGRNMFGLRSDYRELIDGLIGTLLSSTQAKVLLVPHVFGSDEEGEQEQEACSRLLQSAGTRYPGRVFAVAEPLSERELKWVIGRTQFLVASRMHACIAALSQCVPAIGLAYSDKFLGIFESVGVGSAIIDLRKAEISEVISSALQAWECRAKLGAELRHRMPMVQRDIRDVFRALLKRSDPASHPATASGS